MRLSKDIAKPSALIFARGWSRCAFTRSAGASAVAPQRLEAGLGYSFENSFHSILLPMKEKEMLDKEPVENDIACKPGLRRHASDSIALPLT